MKLIHKLVLPTLAVLGVMGSHVASAEEVVRVYNWNDYIEPKILEDFQKETGIRVIYDVFDTNEVLEAKLLSGRSGYDVVVPSAHFLAHQIKAGVYQKLDKAQLPNYKNLDPTLMAQVEGLDPQNQYSFPYTWGTTGFGYNVEKVKELLGDDAPTDSYDLIFDPKYAAKLGQCGISLLDSPDEMIPHVLQYLGLDPNSTKKADYEKAGEVLTAIRPYIRYFHSSRFISDLANGDTCLAFGFSGDILQAEARAKEANNGINIAYTIPKEGANVWFDMIGIPADAENSANAHKFLNYLLKPEVAAQITNFVQYATPNLASQPFVDESIRNNAGIYPSTEVMSKLFLMEERPLKAQRHLTRVWTKVTSGQ